MDLSCLLQQTIIDDLPNAQHILGNTMLGKLWPWGPFLFLRVQDGADKDNDWSMPVGSSTHRPHRPHRGSAEPGQLVGVGTEILTHVTEKYKAWNAFNIYHSET